MLKEISFYIHQYNQKRYDKGCIVLKIAHKKGKQEMTEKVPMTWITWKLNIVWIFISYEQSSIKGLPAKYSASFEVQQNAGVAIGTVGQEVQSKVKGIKVAEQIPIHVYSTDKRKYHLKKKKKDLISLKKTKRTRELQKMNRNTKQQN